MASVRGEEGDGVDEDRDGSKWPAPVWREKGRVRELVSEQL